VIARHLTGSLVAVLLAGAWGCGGGGDEASTERAAQATPSASADARSGRRVVTASVGGRRLSGHCSGTQRAGTPAVLLESGMNGDQEQLSNIENALAGRTLVCSYDRAGTGQSDPPPKRPRPVSELVADLDAFAAATSAQPPYLLVGQSIGGNVVFMYAQTHPEKVAGFVSMNPGPPAKTFLPAAKKVETKEEFAGELSDFAGHNDEGISAHEPTLSRALRADLPYVILFDEDCDGNTGFCRRILPPLTAAMRSWAAVGDGGRFVRAKGAGHNIFKTDPELVQRTITEVLNRAR
jgi:pimeloyl-ACP methyl ester carboxylesterase